MSINNQKVALDKDGYLIDLNEWSVDIANELAKQENISLSAAHWEIINLLQDFYREFEISPAMRALVKYTEKKLGSDKGKSIYLLQLFPPSPAKIASKIAGLPRPTNCL
ncbi:MAG: TusE/DsrC/DsvC family sulfur relay protein [Cellvibrio sp.]|uniref:TusE/DsrC/DsvC family sulfur relay protein n=1 Tax=Cellvibrio sp. TaxID=1965322 RepID=UPI0031B4E881